MILHKQESFNRPFAQGIISNNKIIVSILCFFILSIFLFLTQKITFFTIEEKPTVIFSAPSGIYAETFELSLGSTDNEAEIRYTTGGSNPSPNSATYSSPIEINSPVVIRAQAYKNDVPLGQVISSTYIVGRNSDLPVISIVTAPENLWSSEKGIYSINNFQKSGREWERPVLLEYFGSDGIHKFSTNLGMRIHGGSTRRNAQKGLRVTARNSYGASLINYPFFPDSPHLSFKNLLLRASGNDWGSTMMRDALMQSLVDDLDVDIQDYQPAVVYLNGEYWGIHNIREYFDEQYFKNHYGTELGTIAILEPERSKAGYPSIEEGEAGDEQHYVQMMEFVKNNDLSISENYNYLTTLMDVDNYTDYYLSELYFANDDWLHHNLKVWRFKSDNYQQNTRYGLDGRWRWLLYDTDHGFSRVEKNFLNFSDLLNITKHDFATVLIDSLLKNEEFKINFINRYADMLNSVFLPDVVISKIDAMQQGIVGEIPKHIERWGGQLDRGEDPAFATVAEWEENVDKLRAFALERPGITIEQFISRFNLGGTSSINIRARGKGVVMINKLEISEFPKDVTYFRNNPIPLKAIPSFGYKFMGWGVTGAQVDSRGDVETSVTLSSENVYIVANFEQNFLGRLLGL